MENYIDLSKLSRKGKYIDWSKSIEREIKGKYKGIDFLFVIKSYNKTTADLCIEYNGELYTIKSNLVKDCKIGRVLRTKTKEFKIEIGQVFKDEKRDLIITDREYRERSITSNKNNKTHTQNEKWYKYTCNKCGWTEGWNVESRLLSGVGCACCCPNPMVVVPEINSIWAKSPWMMKFGVSEEDAKKYTPWSNHRLEIKCFHCGKKRMVSPNEISRKGFIKCKKCSDGYTYPEKFMMEILSQLNIEYIPQLSASDFQWCENKEYDFYLPNYNTIIETHGMQHYDDVKGFFKTLEEEQANDKYKQELSLNNDIDEYIVIDCRYSELKWIKSSILNSKLNTMFDLSKIDWLRCGEFAIGNRVKEVCDYWNNKEEWETTTDLEEKFNLAKGTIINYLEKGTELGWCYYNGQEELKKMQKSRCNKVNVYKDGELVHTFESLKQAAREMTRIYNITMSFSVIRNRVDENNKTYGWEYNGFTFMCPKNKNENFKESDNKDSFFMQ